jgi:hypothetical protein
MQLQWQQAWMKFARVAAKLAITFVKFGKVTEVIYKTFGPGHFTHVRLSV